MLHGLLASGPDGRGDPREAALATELFYGVLRDLLRLDFIIGKLRQGFLDPETRQILRLGLYQLWSTRIPAHAAVHATVALAPPRSRALINAILRSAQRERDPIDKQLDNAPPHVRLSHPAFLISRWTDQFGPEETRSLCEWNNRPPQIFGRINLLKITEADFLAAYPECQPQGESMVSLPRLPAEALARGEIYIQDPSTLHAARLLDAQPGMRVLDACAAPGGKTALLAQAMGNSGSIIATERDSHRLDRLTENLTNLGVTCAQSHRVEWGAQPSPWAPASFDRILLDAPCSNTGVLRRRVDARWRLTPHDFARMAATQRALLDAVAPLLRPGGLLVYSTCSIDLAENERVVEAFMEGHPAFAVVKSMHLLPFRDRCDGAYVSAMARVWDQ